MHLGLRRCAALLLVLALCAGFAGCGGTEKHEKTWYTWFDTVTTVIGYSSEKDFSAACAVVEDVLERYHRAADIYHEYGGTVNACTVNRLAGQGPVQAAPELLELLAFGREMYALTDGNCNIAMGAVLSIWHDCREAALSGGAARVPGLEELQEAMSHCRIEDLILDEKAGTAELADPLMRLDLGAVAKGYAAEKAAQALEEAGYTGYALNLGGNVRTVGTKPGGDPWVAGVQEPTEDGDSAYRLRVSLSDAALVTSGSYQRFFEVDGVRYHHIISPDTLFPINDYLSVTILCPNSGLADALSTAVFNMDLPEGTAFVNGLEGTEACWILADGSVQYTEGFKNYILP